jgi:hypothetical protein
VRPAGWNPPDDGEEYEEQYCGNCSGSGEGMYDGSRCWSCKGSGTEWVLVEPEPEPEDEE